MDDRSAELIRERFLQKELNIIVDNPYIKHHLSDHEGTKQVFNTRKINDLDFAIKELQKQLKDLKIERNELMLENIYLDNRENNA